MLEFIVCFSLTVLLAPLIILFLKKLKFGQNILGYVVEHKQKQGTPTIGGLIFIIPTIIVSICFNLYNLQFTLFVMSVFFGYSLIGFLDDFIKIKFNRNLGLRPYQKLLFQLLLSIIVSIYVYRSNIISNEIIIPFTTIKINISQFIIPFIILTFLASTNSVNLTDGIDGLAGSVSLICFIFLGFILKAYSLRFGYTGEALNQITSLTSICFCLSGAILGYLIFNIYPANVFMGDTGSLGLGGILAIIASLSQLELFLIILGFTFVFSSISVILQVIFFKITKRRIFLMAPFHHHLQHKGMHENKIVIIYICITVLAGIFCLIFI